MPRNRQKEKAMNLPTIYWAEQEIKHIIKANLYEPSESAIANWAEIFKLYCKIIYCRGAKDSKFYNAVKELKKV